MGIVAGRNFELALGSVVVGSNSTLRRMMTEKGAVGEGSRRTLQFWNHPELVAVSGALKKGVGYAGK